MLNKILLILLFCFGSIIQLVAQSRNGLNPSEYKMEIVGVKSPAQVIIVNSISHRIFYNGIDKNTLAFDLPAYTLRWYYNIVIAPRDNQNARFTSLLSMLTPLLSKNPYALASGAALQFLLPLPRKESLNIYLMDELEARNKFEKGEVFKVLWRQFNAQSLSGTETAGIGKRLWFGFENETFLQGLSVTIEIVSITGWDINSQKKLLNQIKKIPFEESVNDTTSERFEPSEDLINFRIAQSVMKKYHPREWFALPDYKRNEEIATIEE